MRRLVDAGTTGGSEKVLATVLYGTRDVRLEEVPDPTLHPRPAAGRLDAVVRVEASCVCGSDLWPYRGIEPVDQPHRRGHEWVGIVEEVGANVTTVAPGDLLRESTRALR
jgi:threonine dehydrogenase-like Zn-dependent dehydrogenase